MAKQVLVITPSIKPGGGPPGYVHNLMTGVEELLGAGELINHFEFIGQRSTFRNKATGESKSIGNFRLTLIKLVTKLGLKPFLSKRIRRTKEKIRKCDLLLIQGYQEDYLVKYAKKLGKFIVYMPHSPSIMADEYKMLADLNGVKFDAMHYQELFDNEQQLIDIADCIVLPSEGAGSEYYSNFSKTFLNKRIFHIRSGVPVSTTDDDSIKDANIHTGPLRIFFVGRYVAHKGYDLFCDAADIVCTNTSDAVFFTLGDGPMKKDSPNITNFGWRDDVFEVLKTADIVVVPNRIAYYDLLPLECAALAKPLVMTAVGGNVDQLEQLPDSVSCDTPDAIALAGSIEDAIRKFTLDRRWGQKNKLAYINMFTAKEFARRWDVAVGNIVGKS